MEGCFHESMRPCPISCYSRLPKRSSRHLGTRNVRFFAQKRLVLTPFVPQQFQLGAGQMQLDF